MVTVKQDTFYPHRYEFVMSNENELSKLPKFGVPGTDELNTVKTCDQGSYAYVINSDFKVWMLNADSNQWVLVS